MVTVFDGGVHQFDDRIALQVKNQSVDTAGIGVPVVIIVVTVHGGDNEHHLFHRIAKVYRVVYLQMHTDDRVVGMVINLVVCLVQGAPEGTIQIRELIVGALFCISQKLYVGMVDALQDRSGKIEINVHITAVLHERVPIFGGNLVSDFENLTHLHRRTVEAAFFKENARIVGVVA